MSNQKEHESLPVTIRFPRPGKREFYTGLSRDTLYQMWRQGLLQTTLIKVRGKQGRGTRVIFLRPLLEYLEEHKQFEPQESIELPENPGLRKSQKRSEK